MKYFIGIDSGTSSIKAVLFNIKGEEIDKESKSLQGIFPTEVCYEEDMNDIYDKLIHNLTTLIARNKEKDIMGIGITAQGDGLWLIDKEGNPVRNGFCFCDGRSSDIVLRWNENGVADKIFEKTGNMIFSGNQNCILKWMEENEAESLEKAEYFLHLKDYLFFKLTGKITSDTTDQSLVFVDFDKDDYSDELFEITGLEKYRHKFPKILKAKDNAFELKNEIASQIGLITKVIVTSGPMDVSACALGSGVINPGECCSIIGTSGMHEMVIKKPLSDNNKVGNTITHILDKHWLRLMGSLAGTPNIDWLLNIFGSTIKDEAKSKGKNIYTYIEELLDMVPIGSNGLMYHPYIMAGGERAPFNNSYAKGSYTGISIKHEFKDFIRATYEGVAYTMLDCYMHMPQESKSVTVCGGGANSVIWCQMFSDVMGVDVLTIKGEELGAKGVVINNSVIQGFYDSYEEAIKQTVKIKNLFHPDLEKHKKYMKYYELYKAIYISQKDNWAIRSHIMEEEEG